MQTSQPRGRRALLDGTPVTEWLRGRGHRVRGPVERLAGGVSSAVYAVGDELIVKQALPRLDVADDWSADPRRLLHEAYALRLAAELTPGRVPDLLDVDPIRLVLLLRRAPATWVDWRARLLAAPAGAPDAHLAASLGAVLGTWHAATATRVAQLAADLPAAAGAFEQLRLEPFHRTVATRLPDLAAPVLAAAARLTTPARPVLVHGDFSPKNVLVAAEAPERFWVLDFEVAHVGAAEFDLAFLLTHLLCKSAHRPADGQTLEDCGDQFLTSYTATVPERLRPRWSDVAPQLACLLLARVHGKSPAGYLTADAAAAVSATARALLSEPGADLHTPWRLLDRATRAAR